MSMRKGSELDDPVAEEFDPAHEAGRARVECEREGEEDAQATWELAEKSAEGVDEGEEGVRVGG